MTNTTTGSGDGAARPASRLDGQAPIALIGLAAMAFILAIHFATRPVTPVPDGRLAMAACAQCGTVVAVRRSAHSVPVFIVEVQMQDGSITTVRQGASGFSVGDVVELKGDGLTLRDLY